MKFKTHELLNFVEQFFTQGNIQTERTGEIVDAFKSIRNLIAQAESINSAIEDRINYLDENGNKEQWAKDEILDLTLGKIALHELSVIEWEQKPLGEN